MDLKKIATAAIIGAMTISTSACHVLNKDAKTEHHGCKGGDGCKDGDGCKSGDGCGGENGCNH